MPEIDPDHPALHVPVIDDKVDNGWFLLPFLFYRMVFIILLLSPGSTSPWRATAASTWPPTTTSASLATRRWSGPRSAASGSSGWDRAGRGRSTGRQVRDGKLCIVEIVKNIRFFLFKTSTSTLRRSLPPTSAPSRPSSTPTGSPPSPRPSPPTPRRATSSSRTSASTSPSRRASTPQGARSSTLGTTTVRTCSSCWSSRPLRTRR